ncbi:hypothetical protein [Vagococcus fluvialis]
MKKLRFYRSGSKKEAYFLQNMLAENYLLKKKIGFFIRSLKIMKPQKT